MSGTDWTTTPNHGFYLPIYDMDEGAWGGHLNDNTTALDTLLATTGTTTFLPINGGTMNGKLTLFTAPSAAMDAANKGYVDGFLPLAGGTVSGALTVTGVVTAGAGAATWNSGTGAPTATRPIGSLYSRTDGAVGTTLYVSQGGGTWAAVSGV